MSNLKIFSVISYLKEFYIYLPLMTFFLLAHGISLQAVIFATTIYSLASFFSEVPTGLLADRFGQKWSLVLGYMLGAIGLFLVLLFPTTIGLYIGTAIQGLAASFVSGSEEALLYESVKHEKQDNFQKIYGRFLSNGQISFIIATVIAGFAYERFGLEVFDILMIITCSMIFLSGVMAIFFKDYAVKIQDDSKGSGMYEQLKQGFKLINKNKTVFTLTVITVLTISGEWFLLGVYQPYFQLHGVPAVWMGVTLSLGSILNMLATRYTYILEQYISLQKILLYLNLILGFSYLAMASFVHPVFLIGVYIFMKGIMNLQVPIISDYINSHTPPGIRATVLSGISFYRRMFQVALIWVLGVVVGFWGVQTSLILQGAYLITGIAIGYYLLVRCRCDYKVINPKGEQLKFI